MAGKEVFFDAQRGGPIASTFKLREWAARNVSGLPVARLTARPGQSTARVVLFHDRASTYHSEGQKNIYTNPADWRYYASYGYLDGHAEGRSYSNKDEYVAQLHAAIPQGWWGKDFTQVFPEQYTGR